MLGKWHVATSLGLLQQFRGFRSIDSPNSLDHHHISNIILSRPEALSPRPVGILGVSAVVSGWTLLIRNWATSADRRWIGVLITTIKWTF